MINYHTHTVRCHHGFGTDREFIEKAIEAGYTEIGFSDHAPCRFPVERPNIWRMDVEAAGEYVRSLRLLRDEFADRITIHIGFEMEYYPALFQDMLTCVKEAGAEYLILGQHFTKNEYDGGYHTQMPTDDAAILKEYFDQCLEGMRTGCFSYLAHPDILPFTGSVEVYQSMAAEFLDGLKKINGQIEFNRLGFAEGRSYPRGEFWEVVARKGVETVIGLDAHRPEVYSDTATVERMEAALRQYGITPVKPKLCLLAT